MGLCMMVLAMLEMLELMRLDYRQLCRMHDVMYKFCCEV